MKSVILSLGLILLLILALTGCSKYSAKDTTPVDEETGQQDQQLDKSEETEIIEDVDKEFIDEDEYVEIGEMI